MQLEDLAESGSEIVKALKANEVQGGNMRSPPSSKAVRAANRSACSGLAINDVMRANADDPLAIIASKDSGIKAGDLKTLQGKKVGVWFEGRHRRVPQDRAHQGNQKKGEVELVNI